MELIKKTKTQISMSNKLSLKNFEPQGKRGVIVQLIPYPETSDKSESGIYMPKYKSYETDGGRAAARIDKEKYSLVGHIRYISACAKSLMEKEDMQYSIGDMVSVLSHAKNQSNWLIEDKLQQVADFTGLLLITPEHLECKITNYEND